VTIEYHQGLPLGLLLGTIRDGTEVKRGDNSAFIDRQPVGANSQFVAQKTGTLYFRINDSPDSVLDNSGRLQVRVEVR